MSYRVRFAPSPTGQLHIGNLEVLLLNNLYKIVCKGSILLRIDFTHGNIAREDIEKFISGEMYIISTFFNVGFSEILIQEDNKDLYRKYLDYLIAKNCISKQGYIYYIDFTDRLPEYIEYRDTTFGVVRRHKSTIKNVAIFSEENNKYFYNFCSVIDDIESNITHIIRGSDHLDNNILQIAIMMLLNVNYIPIVTTVPLCRFGNVKISKRDKTIYSILSMIEDHKILPTAFINYFFYNESIKIKDQTEIVEIPHISRNYKNFDLEKLKVLNTKLLRKLNFSEIAKYLAFFKLQIDERDWLVVRENIVSLNDIPDIMEKIQKVKTHNTDFFQQSNIDGFMNLYNRRRLSNEYIEHTIRDRIFRNLQGNITTLIEYFLGS